MTEPPYLKGEAEILDEKGNVIGIATVAYYNPNYRPWCNLPKSSGNESK